MSAVLAPITGRLLPLEEVPDEAFAQKMLGDGVAIEPEEGAVLSPFDGTVVALPSTFHAIGLRSEEGMALLIHVGIDTVGMKGEGFHAYVLQNEKVYVRQPLLTFDRHLVSQKARSILSPVVLTNGPPPLPFRTQGRVVAGRDVLLEEEGKQPFEAEASIAMSEMAVHLPPTISLHARPAARFVEKAKSFSIPIRVRNKGCEVDAKSILGILSLDIGKGTTFTLIAEGEGAEEALKALARFLDQDLGGERDKAP